jgi:hypothetical protein
VAGAMIEEPASTTVIFLGQRMQVDEWGNLLITMGAQSDRFVPGAARAGAGHRRGGAGLHASGEWLAMGAEYMTVDGIGPRRRVA